MGRGKEKRRKLQQKKMHEKLISKGGGWSKCTIYNPVFLCRGNIHKRKTCQLIIALLDTHQMALWLVLHFNETDPDPTPEKKQEKGTEK